MALDLTKIQFPSDDLRISQIQKLYPKMDEVGIYHPPHFSEVIVEEPRGDSLDKMLQFEREYHEKTKDHALKDLLIIENEKNIQEHVRRELIQAYIRHALAMGPQSADKLIESIERQAQAQGKSFP